MKRESAPLALSGDKPLAPPCANDGAQTDPIKARGPMVLRPAGGRPQEARERFVDA